MTPIYKQALQKILVKPSTLQQIRSTSNALPKVVAARTNLSEALEVIKEERRPTSPSEMINDNMFYDDETSPVIQTPAPTLLFNQQPAAAANPTKDADPLGAHKTNMRKFGLSF